MSGTGRLWKHKVTPFRYRHSFVGRVKPLQLTLSFSKPMVWDVTQWGSDIMATWLDTLLSSDRSTVNAWWVLVASLNYITYSCNQYHGVHFCHSWKNLTENWCLFSTFFKKFVLILSHNILEWPLWTPFLRRNHPSIQRFQGEDWGSLSAKSTS